MKSRRHAQKKKARTRICGGMAMHLAFTLKQPTRAITFCELALSTMQRPIKHFLESVMASILGEMDPGMCHERKSQREERSHWRCTAMLPIRAVKYLLRHSDDSCWNKELNGSLAPHQLKGLPLGEVRDAKYESYP